MTFARRWTVIGLAVLAPLFFVACGGSKATTKTPCSSGAWLHIPLDSSVAAMTQPTITVCRNGACYPWAPQPLPTTGSGGTEEAIPAGTTTDSIKGTFWRNADGTVTLDIEWWVTDPTVLVDGDRYQVTLADGTDPATTILDKSATYAASGPSGGPTCPQATLSP